MQRTRVTLTVPAKPEYAHVARSTVTSLFATVDAPFEAVEDVRMAVEEAFVLMLSAGQTSGELTYTFTTDDEALHIVVESQSDDGETPSVGDDEAAQVSRTILEALTDECTVNEFPTGIVVTLVKKLTGG